MKCSIDSLN